MNREEQILKLMEKYKDSPKDSEAIEIFRYDWHYIVEDTEDGLIIYDECVPKFPLEREE